MFACTNVHLLDDVSIGTGSWSSRILRSFSSSPEQLEEQLDLRIYDPKDSGSTVAKNITTMKSIWFTVITTV